MLSQTDAQHEFVQQIICCFCEGQQVVPFSLITKRDQTCLAFSSTLGCAWILKGICERFLIASPSLSSGGGGEASEASPRTVPAGVTATPGVLRVGPQSNRAQLFRRGVTAICWCMIYVIYSKMRHFCWLFGRKKRESKSVQMCEICIEEIYVLFLSFLCAVVCLMSRKAASAMTSECVYLTCRNKMSKESCCCSTVHPRLLQCRSDWAASASPIQLKGGHMWKHWRNNPGKGVTWLRLNIPGPLWMSCTATPETFILLTHTHAHAKNFVFFRPNITV